MLKQIIYLSLLSTIVFANDSFYDPFNYTKKEIITNVDNNNLVEVTKSKLSNESFLVDKPLEIKKQEAIDEDEFDKLVREASINKKDKEKKIETISVDSDLDKIPSIIAIDQKSNVSNKTTNIKGNLVSLNNLSKQELTMVKQVNEIKDVKLTITNTSKENITVNNSKIDVLSNTQPTLDNNGLYFDKNINYVLLYTTEDLFLARNKLLLNNILNYKLLKDRKNEKNYGIIVNKDEYNYDKIKSLYKDNKVLNYDKLKELFYLEKKY